MIELLIRVTATLMVSAAIYLIVQLFLLIQEQRKGSRSAARRLEQLRKNQRLEVDLPRQPYRATAQPTVAKPMYSTYSTPPTYTTNYQRGELESRLLSMLGGQRETAIRLLVSIRTRHPERDEHWCLEKALRDLERDRL